MPGSDLLYEKRAPVARITLDRPERLNAISRSMLEDLSASLSDADRDESVRVIILTGAGRGFCSGLDLQEQARELGNSRRVSRFDLRGAPPIVLHNVDKPVLCALNGAAAGYAWTSRWGATFVSRPRRRNWRPCSRGAASCRRAAGAGSCRD